jgi:hypothetical protein
MPLRTLLQNSFYAQYECGRLQGDEASGCLLGNHDRGRGYQAGLLAGAKLKGFRRWAGQRVASLSAEGRKL